MPDHHESPRQQVSDLISKSDQLQNQAEEIQKQLAEVAGRIEKHKADLSKSSHEIETVTDSGKSSVIGPEVQDR